MDLFAFMRVRKQDPVTSFEAAESTKSFVSRYQGLILDAMADGNPLASEQIADIIGLDHSAVWRRMSELEKGRKIIKTDLFHINRSGRRAYKYRIA